MIDRSEDATYRHAMGTRVTGREQMEAWDAASLLCDVIAGRVQVYDGDEELLDDAITTIEQFLDRVTWES